MKWLAKIRERVARRRKNASHVGWRDVLAGDVLGREALRRQIPLVILIVVLSLLLVYNRFAHEAELRRIESLKKELTDVKNTSLTISKELMQMSRQSYVMKKLEEQGSTLQLSSQPAFVVE